MYIMPEAKKHFEETSKNERSKYLTKKKKEIDTLSDKQVAQLRRLIPDMYGE